MMIGILVTIVINTFIAIVILHYVMKPKIIEIQKDPEGVTRKVIMTPHGTFMHEKKRDPVINDDEALALRDENN